MMILLKPKKGGFLRPFGCGWFIREYLLGNQPYGAPEVDPFKGAPQAEIFFQYKTALIAESAMDRALQQVEEESKKQNKIFSIEHVARYYLQHIGRIPYKTTACRYHSFVVYFSQLTRLGWVEFSGYDERSAFQDNYTHGQPRKYYRLTEAGRMASDSAWANPQKSERDLRHHF